MLFRSRASLVAQWSAWQCRGHGFNPWSGKIPHAAEQLSPCTTTTETALWKPRATTTEPRATTTEARVLRLLKPECLEPVLHNKRSHRNEKPPHHNEEWPPLTATRESPRAATKTQCSQKRKEKKKIETKRRDPPQIPSTTSIHIPVHTFCLLSFTKGEPFNKDQPFLLCVRLHLLSPASPPTRGHFFFPWGPGLFFSLLSPQC